MGDFPKELYVREETGYGDDAPWYATYVTLDELSDWNGTEVAVYQLVGKKTVRVKVEAE